MHTDGREAHPADAVALHDTATQEWQARTQLHSAAARLMGAVSQLKKTVPYVGGEALAPAAQALHALEYWQQAYFGGTHAVDDETQTKEPAPN